MVLIYQHQYLTQEEKRLKEDRELTLYWKHWSPYVAETMGYWFVLFLSYSSLFWMSFGDLFFFFFFFLLLLLLTSVKHPYPYPMFWFLNKPQRSRGDRYSIHSVSSVRGVMSGMSGVAS